MGEKQGVRWLTTPKTNLDQLYKNSSQPGTYVVHAEIQPPATLLLSNQTCQVPSNALLASEFLFLLLQPRSRVIKLMLYGSKLGSM